MFKMFSCRDISKLACHKDDMSFSQKLNFKIHLFMCEKCRNYTSSIDLIGKSFGSVIKSRREVSKDNIDNLENRVLESLRKKNER